MAQRTLNVLFVCEKNSIRSIMAEALLNRFGEGRFRAFGADLEPAAKVHPLTLELMQSSGLPTAHLRPQSFREFMTPGAAKMDFVILMGAKTMTAAVRGLPGHPMLAQWGISDPVISGDVVAQRFAFRRAFRELENRIRLFVLVQQKRQPERAFEEPQQAQNA